MFLAHVDVSVFFSVPSSLKSINTLKKIKKQVRELE